MVSTWPTSPPQVLKAPVRAHKTTSATSCWILAPLSDVGREAGGMGCQEGLLQQAANPYFGNGPV